MFRLLPHLLLLISTTAVADEPILQIESGGHTSICKWVGFTPDGTRLVSAGHDKVVRVWDVRNPTLPRLERSLRFQIGAGPEGKIYATALSTKPDAAVRQIMALGGYTKDNEIRLIDLDTGEVLGLLQGHTNVINSLAFSADGRLLASGSADKTVRVWEVDRTKLEAVKGTVLSGHTAPIYGLAFLPDGRLVSGSDDHTLRLWKRKNDTWESQVLKGHTADVMQVVCSPDGEYLASSSFDHSVRLWDCDGKFIRVLGKIQGTRDLAGFNAKIAFAPDSRRLVAAAGRDTGGSHVWRVPNGDELARFDGHDNTVRSVGVTGNMVASAGGDNNEIFLWDATTGKQFSRLVGSGRTVWAVGFAPDGKSLAWGNTGTSNASLMRSDGKLEQTFDLISLSPSGAVSKPDTFRRGLLTSAGLTAERTAESTLTLRRGQRTLATIERREKYDWINCYAFVPGGSSSGRIVVGSAFGLTLHDAASGRKIHDFVGHTGIIWAVAVSSNGRFLLSGSKDQTLRLWNLQTAELLLSFFVGKDNDWVAWTPQGYHKSSPGGQRLIGWHVNRGIDKAAEFFSAAQLGKGFYRPDILAKLLDTGSVAEAVKLADAERGKTTTVSNVAEALPPIVRITAPQRPASGKSHTLEQSRLTVTAEAESRGQQPVVVLKLLLDGRPSQGKIGERRFDQPKFGTVTADWTVEVTPGPHKLQVLAESAVSVGKSEEVPVAYVGGGLVDVKLPNLYVVAFGVSKYKQEDLQLNYAAKDAEELVTTLKAHSGKLFSKIEVRLSTDEKATKENLLKNLTWLRKQMTQNDCGVCFFAGHGDKDADGALYFLPVDADPADLFSTALPAEQLKSSLKATPGRLILMLDACHSGGLDKARGRKRDAASLTDDLVRDLISDESGLIVMASSTGRESSLENNEHRRGNFSLAVTEGLSGKADFNNDGTIYNHELDLYVTDRVKSLSKGRQHPVSEKPTSVKPFPLAKPK